MKKRNRLQEEGQRNLERQFSNARGKSRMIAKRLGEDKELIFSEQSLKTHMNSWNHFSDWVFENYQIRSLNKITPEHVEKYIKELNSSEKGVSKKTLQTRISAVNKVMGNRWNDDVKPKLSKMDIEVNSHKENSYKQFTAQEWRERNEKRYENYKETFDTVSAFGLRKSEMKGLNDKSFLIDKNNKIYVQTIGKGGKYRIAECTSEKNNEMIEKYQNIATKINEIDDFNLDKKLLERAIQDDDSKLNLKGLRNDRNSWHIFRAEYAQTLLKEKIEVFNEELNKNYEMKQGYTKIKVHQTDDERLKKTYTQIGAYKGSALAFAEVSRNLGHNRLDVMLKYI